jgi:tricorn protease interacting factor F2/3
VVAKELDPEDRWGIQNDLYALVKRGDVSIDEYLSFLSNYREEDAFLPLDSMTRNLFQAFLVMDGDRRERIAAVGRSLIEGVLQRIGFEPRAEEKWTLSLLRDRIIWPAVLYGSRNVEEWAVDQFERLIHGQTIHPDLRKSIMQVGAMRATGITFDWFDEAFQSSESEHDRINLLTAMGCASDTGLIIRVQQYTLDKVPSRNKFIPIVSLASNPHALPHMWDWFITHLESIEQFHPMHYERVIAVIVPLGGLGCEDKVRTFFERYTREKDKARDVIRLSLEKLEIYSRMRCA